MIIIVSQNPGSRNAGPRSQTQPYPMNRETHEMTRKKDESVPLQCSWVKSGV
jgi:hypothetical protein